MLLQLSQGVPLVAKGHQHRIDGQAAVVNGHGGLRRTCLDTAPLLYFTAVLPLEGPPMLAWWRLVETPEPDAWQVFLSSLSPELAALHEHPPDDVLELAGGRTVDVAAIFAVLVEQLTTPVRVGPRAVRSDRGSSAQLAASWRHNLFRQVHAVVLLRKAGLLNEARPNARTCLEHAIALRRLALAAGDGQLGPLTEEITYQAQQRQLDELKYLDELDQAAGGVNRHLVTAAREQLMANPVPHDKSRPQMRIVKAVFEGVPHGLHLYDIYKRLSESTHAGLGSADPYLAPAQRSGGLLSAEPELEYWAEYAALLSWSC
jgi:hypothetical protein